MSVTGVSSGTNLGDLAAQILRNFDSNGDGMLNGVEFGTLIRQLTGQFNLGSALSGSTSAATTPVVASGAQVGSAAPVFTGFNFQRAQDPNRSAKDAFAMLANRAGTMPTTKAEAQLWFETHIRKGMEELGHTVNWVDGDKFSFTNWQGTYTIDFVRDAGGPDPALAWSVTG